MFKVLISLVVLNATAGWMSSSRSHSHGRTQVTGGGTVLCYIPPDRAFYQLMLSSQVETESDDLFEFQLGLLNIIDDDKSDLGTEYLGRLSHIVVSKNLERFRDEVITKRGQKIIKWLERDSCSESRLNLCQRFWSAGCESNIKCPDYSANNRRLIRMINKGEVIDTLLEGLKKLTPDQRCTILRKMKKTGRATST